MFQEIKAEKDFGKQDKTPNLLPGEAYTLLTLDSWVSWKQAHLSVLQTCAVLGGVFLGGGVGCAECVFCRGGGVF